jgi:chromate transporter
VRRRPRLDVSEGARVSLAVQPAERGALRAPPSPGALFLVFLKMGAFGFGGVYSMLSLFERELVERRGWLTSAEFAEGVAIGQLTPGPPIVNTGVFVGYRLAGLRGAIAATVGQVLPGFLLVLALAVLYGQLRSSPLVAGALRGVGAAVVGLLASVVLRMGRRVLDGWGPVLLALAAFALLAFARANPLLLVAAAGAAGWLLFRGRR